MRRILSMEGLGQRHEGVVLSLEEEQIMLDEAAVDAAEVATDLSEAERIVEVSDALEDLAVIADSIEEASPAEVALIETAGDMAVAGSDVQAEEIIPSMESFKGGRISTEDIRETAMAIWKSIQSFLKKIWEKIEGFFYKLFGTIPSLRKRLKALEAQVDNAAGKKLEEKKFTISSGVAALCVDYKAMKSESELGAAVKTFGETVNYVFKGDAEVAAKLAEKLADAIGDFDPEKDLDAQGRAVVALFKSGVNAKAPGATAFASNANYSGFEVSFGAQLLGNQRLVTKMYSDNKNDASVLGVLDRVRRAGEELVTAREKAGSIPGDFEFQTLSLSGCNSLIKQIEDILDTLEEYQRGKPMKEVMKAKKQLETASEKASKAFEKMKNAESDSAERKAVPMFKALLNFNASYARWVQQPAVPFASHSMTVVRALMMVVQKSVAQYK